jgi:prevent-host-death family protein
MRVASVAEITKQLPRYLAEAKKRKEPIVVTQRGKPYALIQPLTAGDLEQVGWQRLAAERLRAAWDGEDDALYDYL